MRRYAITDRTLFSRPSESRVSAHSSPIRVIRGIRVRPNSAPLLQPDRPLGSRRHRLHPAPRKRPSRRYPGHSRPPTSSRIIHNTGTKLLINSRLDVAIATAAHGVHLTSAPGQLTPAQVRAALRRRHASRRPSSPSPATPSPKWNKPASNVDLILFAPVFHKIHRRQLITPGQGLEALHAACLAAAPTPVYALGGVTLENAPACLAAGAAGVAGIHLFHALIRSTTCPDSPFFG